jgi:hypothetical protein
VWVGADEGTGVRLPPAADYFFFFLPPARRAAGYASGASPLILISRLARSARVPPHLSPSASNAAFSRSSPSVSRSSAVSYGARSSFSATTTDATGRAAFGVCTGGTVLDGAAAFALDVSAWLADGAATAAAAVPDELVIEAAAAAAATTAFPRPEPELAAALPAARLPRVPPFTAAAAGSAACASSAEESESELSHANLARLALRALPPTSPSPANNRFECSNDASYPTRTPASTIWAVSCTSTASLWWSKLCFGGAMFRSLYTSSARTPQSTVSYQPPLRACLVITSPHSEPRTGKDV